MNATRLGAFTRLFGGFVFAVSIAHASMESDMLSAHNAVRAHVNVPPLAWSVPLANRAQDWATRLLADNLFKHTPNNPYGQNLFETSGALATPAEVVSHWQVESADYDYASNKCRATCGHYTQLVWATTKRVGCGVARNSRVEIWVCDYDPPGNIIGRRPY